SSHPDGHPASSKCSPRRGSRSSHPDGPSPHPLHNSRYDFNDEILPLGAALHASLVEQALPRTA
ncbi:MAG: hypothetical protein ACOVOX_05105, partial [Burkholderiaceae bacterium]